MGLRTGRLLQLALGMTFLVSAGQAIACRVSSFHSSFIHNALPAPLPAGTLVAEVEFEAAADQVVFERGVRARVRRVIQGNSEGRHLLVWPLWWTSCSHPFENGTAGLIVAVPRGTRKGLLVVDPIPVTRNRGYRLDDGYQLPPGYAEQARLPDQP